MRETSQAAPRHTIRVADTPRHCGVVKDGLGAEVRIFFDGKKP